MASLKLWEYARVGDINLCRYLVEIKKVDVNEVNEWNASPLYYAAHGGHIELVSYLLGHGAICEEQTFQGERCYYGALTDEIREVLRKYKYTASARSPFREFWRLLSEKCGWGIDVDVCGQASLPANADFNMAYPAANSESSHNRSDDNHNTHYRMIFPCHKLVLGIRCPRFAEKFVGDWRHKNGIRVNGAKIPAKILASILRYIYCGKLEFFSDATEEVLRVMEAFNLDTSKVHKSINVFGDYDFPYEGSRLIQVEDDVSELSALWESVAIECLKNIDEMDDLPFAASDEIYKLRQLVEATADVRFKLDDGSTYALHRFILEERSDYFKKLLTGDFADCAKGLLGKGSLRSHLTDTQERPRNIPTLELKDMNAQVFAIVVMFLYSNRATGLSVRGLHMSSEDVLLAENILPSQQQKRPQGTESDAYSSTVAQISVDSAPHKVLALALSVLDCAERLIIPDLKPVVGTMLKKFIATPAGCGYVFDVLDSARRYFLQSLEDACYNVIAEHILDIAESEEARDRLEFFIRLDAATVRSRQTHDSVPIVDEITTWIKHHNRADSPEAKLRLQSLRGIVAELGIGMRTYSFDD
jgi:ankyrin repeat/BTB/POZ domain-containing protein 1